MDNNLMWGLMESDRNNPDSAYYTGSRCESEFDMEALALKLLFGGVYND